jgi:TonB family protein
MPRSLLLPLILLAASAGAVGCIDTETARTAIEAIQSGPPKPDVLPVMLNEEVPIHYPAELYARKVQGNTILRIFIDGQGRVHPESTMVIGPSGYPAFDSAAVAAVPELRFKPAMLKGEPLAVTIQFPVFFRHPEAAPLPGDTILKKRSVGSRQ